MSEMPEVIAVKKEMMTRGHYNYDVLSFPDATGYDNYHHARIVQALREENDVISSKLKFYILAGVEKDKRIAEIEALMEKMAGTLRSLKSYIDQDGQSVRDLYPVFGLDGAIARSTLNESLTLYEKFKADVASAEGV